MGIKGISEKWNILWDMVGYHLESFRYHADIIRIQKRPIKGHPHSHKIHRDFCRLLIINISRELGIQQAADHGTPHDMVTGKSQFMEVMGRFRPIQ